MSKPAISVVLVVRNVERFLAESIESVIRQSYRDFEFIIVDFGSTDGSKGIASRYAATDSRIRSHEVPDCRLTDARNAGCFLAEGKYIAIMDADDVSMPDRLAREVEVLESHPEVAVVGGATEWIDADGKSLFVDYVPVQDHEITSALATRCPFWHSSVLIRREAFVNVGGYRRVFDQAEDYDLWLRLSERYQCANLREVVLRYRIHPHQLTLRRQRQQTLCRLAARASASLREQHKPDPLDECSEITPELLHAMGVSESVLESSTVADCHDWVLLMAKANAHSAALGAAIDVLRSDLKYAERRQVSDLYLTVANLHWRENRFWKGWLAASRAAITRPLVVARPFRPLLRWVGLLRLTLTQ